MSRSPNLSAIEDRAIAQSERISEIRAEMRAEAQQHEDRLRMAASTGTVVQKPFKAAPFNPFRGKAENRVSNEICFGCGTRQDKHDEFGCKRWRI